jgi:hypothetical protein
MSDPVSSVVGAGKELSAAVSASKQHGADAGEMIGGTAAAVGGAVAAVTAVAATVAGTATVGAVATAMGIGALVGNAIPIPFVGAAIGAIVGAFIGLGLWLSSAGHQPPTNLIAKTPEQARYLLDIFRVDPTFLFRFWDQVGRSAIDPASPDTWPAGTQMVDPSHNIWTKRDDARWVVTGKASADVQTMKDPFDAARKSNPAAPPYGWLDTNNKPHFGGKLLAVQPGGWGPLADDLKLSPDELANKFAWVFSQIVILIRELRIASGDCSPSMASAGIHCTPYSDKTAKTPLGHPVTVADSWYWGPFKGNEALGKTSSDPIESYVFWSGTDVDEPLTSIHNLARLYWLWIRNKTAPPEVRSPTDARRILKVLRAGLRSGMSYQTPSGKMPVVFDQSFVDELKTLRGMAGESGPDAALAKIVGADVTPVSTAATKKASGPLLEDKTVGYMVLGGVVLVTIGAFASLMQERPE